MLIKETANSRARTNSVWMAVLFSLMPALLRAAGHVPSSPLEEATVGGLAWWALLLTMHFYVRPSRLAKTDEDQLAGLQRRIEMAGGEAEGPSAKA